MAGPIISGILFSLLLLIISLLRPNASRIFLGFLFIVSGLGINLAFVLTNPEAYVNYGKDALIPAYGQLSSSILSINPVLFGILLIIFEVTMGLLLLNKSTNVKIGLIGVMLFVILLIPLNIGQVTWAGLVISFLYLLTKDFDETFLEMIRKRLKQRES